ncbi:hypothetical protein DOM21_16675 [Bacteriovorax stolpii]|uniref:thioesterase domain-containing protein n=1 Tax=Bacteriovorax stolpii TaxID=960 RepID=UPI001158D900|nr:thioesterase domain-containing protein [Bacteriovorax stolpii]QDK43059.1 hypothetical protein DOM21_16675 [Bacteriovorax stolpii]
MTTKVADKAPVKNSNLQNLKPFRGNGKLLSETANATKTAEGLPKAEITDQAKMLKAQETTTPAEPAPETAPEQPSSSPSTPSSSVMDKAASVAKAIAKAPVMPVVVPKNTKSIENKISDKKPDAPPHFIKKPAVIFIEGFSAFGISNGDGIKEMSDNFPGAKRFDWTEHDQIVGEIKKHAPDQPVVLVGHSFGGDTAIEVANELNSAKNGFRPIDLLVSIDAVGMNKTIIPINVKSNLNFFGEGILPFVHGDPTVARNTKYTEVTNELRSDMHSKMDDSPEVQFEIFQKINEVLGNAGQEDIFIEISETSQIKDVLDAIKNSL